MIEGERIYDTHPYALMFYAHKARADVSKAQRRGDTRSVNLTLRAAKTATTAALRAELGLHNNQSMVGV